MATQGIELPVSLQIKNLQEIANQIKLFANKNVLADSLGGKKVDSELAKILSRLEQISAKSKTAFTTQSDFTSIQKDIGQVELSLNKVHETIKNLGFEDLKIPSEFSGQISALQGRIKELNGSLATFKGTQKEKLVNNVDFMADLQAADPKQAAKWLEKGYDELYKAINEGMTRVNTTLALKAAEFENQQRAITQNSKGKTSMTQWGALQFIQDAFKTLPNDDKQRNTAQEWISKFMKEAEDGKEFSGFSKGAQGMNGFLKSIKEKFSFTDEQMAEMRARIKQQVQALRDAGEKEATAATVVKSMGHNEGLAKQILFGDGANNIELSAKKYATQIRDAERMLQEKTQLEGRAEAFGRVQVAFDIPNKEIEQKAAEIAAALKVPEEALKGFEAQVLSAATKSPQLAALFQQATGEIAILTNTIEQGKQKLQSIDNTINKMQGISNFINRYVGLYAIVRKVTTAVRNAFNNIKELDKAITAIAVVTNMSQQDLWGKIGEYTAMAQQYGVATKDVYTVSQIFYQQGLQTTQVMQMTTESLKMAKIAGIDYTTAANAMTVAVRAFKLEMSEAQAVTDTYSALAAKFAVSSAEIANAMEKTASSAASVGMSLQSTSAFISVMEQTTRESAQNIGSALKSIISRYGEMKASPDKLLNVEGEDVAFNKVDTALKSIGISIKDASGQFRDFDDVIMELASKWDSLDNNTQRYIATIMAGNRQQSRFIALVSNYDELSRAMNVASNSENASIVQVAKTMDSLESKTNQLKNAFSQLYLDLHIEEGLKGAYDWLTRILKTVGKLGTLKGVLPTLINIIGFGTGAKSLVKAGMDRLQEQKKKYEVDTTEAQHKIDEIRAKASEEINTKWKIQADLSQLTVQKNALDAELSTATKQKDELGTKAYQAYLGAGGYRTRDEFDAAVANGTNFKNELSMAGKSSQDQQAAEQAIEAYQGAINRVEELSSSVGRLDSAINGLTQSTEQGKEATNQKTQAEEQAKVVVEQKAQAEESARITVEQSKYSKGEEIISSDELAKAKELEAQAAYRVIDATTGEEIAEKQLILTKDEEGNAVYQLINSKTGEIQATYSATNTTHEKTNAEKGSTGALRELEGAAKGAAGGVRQLPGGTGGSYQKGTGLSWADWGSGNAIKYAGIATGVARLLGTAITATGASIQDKSTDTVERSKIWTGIGNGISMAGTGASMGMALGPWGAAIGGIAGLLIGGLGPVIDGITMTLSEQIALKKEEAKAASDESMKAQAKATDLSSQIDNLKQLQSAMYNSTEDMQAYKDAMNTMADQYPELISAYDSAGDAIIEIIDAEATLSEARLAGASAAREAAIKNLDVTNTQLQAWNQRQVSGIIDEERLKYLDIITAPNASNESIVQTLMQQSLPWFQERGAELEGYFSNPYNSSIDLTKEIPDSIKEGLITPLEGWFTTNQKELGLRSIDEVALRNENSGNWTAEQLQRVLAYVKAQEDKLKTQAENLNKVANSATGFETLLTYLDIDSTISQSNKSQLETTKNYQGLFNELLLDSFNKKNATLSPDEQYTNLYEWQTVENSDYTQFTSEVYQSFIDWYNGLSDSLKEEFSSLDFTEYTNAQEIIDRFGIDESLQESFEEQFIKANQANRDRILKTIYAVDENTGEYHFNENLTGLRNISGAGVAQEITNQFLTFMDEQGNLIFPSIISKYADYFTSQLLAVNNLAEEGYTELASTRLSVLNTFANSLANMGSKEQEEMFGIITNIDFSSYDSIQTAIKGIEEYAKKNNILDIANDKKFGELYQALTSAVENILFNVNTVAQEVITTVTNASDKIDSILATNKSGLSFNKALEDFTNLQAQFSELTSFDQVYTYDAVLNQYVYTQNGLAKAIEAQEQKLNDQVTQLTETTKIYTEKITSWDEEVKGFQYDQVVFLDNADFQDVDSLTKAFDYAGAMQQGETAEETAQIRMAYQSLFADYLAVYKNIGYSESSLIAYIEQRAQEAKDASDSAILIQNEFQSNKKHQLYQAIDWSKLALGTDYSGTNKQLSLDLAKELGFTEQKDWRSGKTIGWKTSSGRTYDELNAESILDEYLAQLYEGQDNAVQLIADAKARIQSQTNQVKDQQVSNAISEILENTGNILSEETIALIHEIDPTGEIIKLDNGKLVSSIDEVQAALITYNNNIYNSISKANEDYLKILNTSFAKNNAGKALLSSGNKLDLSTLESSFSTLGIKLSDIYKKNEEIGQFEWTDGFENALTTDIFGETKITNFNEFLNKLKEKGIEIQESSEEYKKWYRAYIDGQIADLDEIDSGKLATNVLSALSSAKVGTRINIQALRDHGEISDDLIQQLDADRDGIFEVTSEYERDTWLLAINAVMIQDEELKQEVLNIQRSIKANRNQFTNLKNIIGKSFDRNTANNYLKSTGLDTTGWIDSSYDSMMGAMGFIWDEYTQTYKATEAAVNWANGQVEKAIKNNESKEVIAELQKQANDLATELEKDPLKDAIISLLSNYSNVSDDAINEIDAQLKAQKIDINIKDYIHEINGKKVLDVEGLKDVLLKYDELFIDAINSLKDEYISNAEKAGSLIVQGTTGMADMAAFQEAYKELTGIDIEFFYDSLIQSWTFDAIYLRNYLSKVAEKTGLDKAGQEQWIKDQLQILTVDNLDFSSYLSGITTKKERATLIHNLENYYKTHIDDYDFTESIEQWVESQINDTLEVLSYGGQQAINRLKSIKGELTQDEIEAAYRAQIEPLKQLTDSIDDLQAGSIVAKNQIDALNKAGFKVNADGVITSTGKLLQAYASLYVQMEDTNEATIAELNSMMGKYLDSRDGEQIVIDALSNASNMTYSQLADIYTQAGKKLTEQMVDDLESSGIIKHLGGSRMMIMDFKRFAEDEMDWAAGSEEYIQGFKAYNDALIEYDHKLENSVVESIKNIATARPGDKINLTELASRLEGGLDTVLEFEGAKLEQGILTITEDADIQSIIKDIGKIAADNAAIIPSQLEELAEAIRDYLSGITSLISNGVKGSLSLTDKNLLIEWANAHGIKNLDFRETIDGFKLANNSAIDLYNTIKKIDDIQGQIVFTDLKDALIESDERFKSAMSTAAYIRNIESKGLTEEQNKFLLSLNGNVNTFNRPVLQNVDGTISTLLTATEDSRNYQSEIPWIMNISPITPNGDKLTDAELRDYIQKLVEESSGNMDEMIKLDKGELGLIIEGENTEIEQQEEILKAYDERAEKLHLIGEIIEENKEKSAKELELAYQIAEARAVTEDDSFKFMEQVIPSGQNNPLNYWENWGKAFEVINNTSKGSDKGKMAYQDFYNLITEMGNLADITGQAIQIGENVKVNAENVASLIEQAAGALEVQSDGSLKVNLSKIGVDFAQGTDQMANNIDDGIHQIAQSQIDMLDGLIGLLEAIITMEDAFKNMDVDSDLSLDISELFNVTDDSNLDGITDFSDKWKDELQKLQDMMNPKKADQFNADFTRGMESIKFTINGQIMSLRQVIESSWEQLKDSGMTPELYQSIMNGVWEAARNGDYTEENVKEIIMEKLQKSVEGSGGEVYFDMGKYTFVGTGTANYMIDWDDEATKAALARLGTEEHQQLIEALRASDKGEATHVQIESKLIYEKVLDVNTRKFKIKGSDGKDYDVDLDSLLPGEQGEKLAEAALGTEQLKALGAKKVTTDVQEGTAEAHMKFGEMKVTTSTKGGKITYTDEETGVTGTSLRNLVDNIVDKQYAEWEGHNEQASQEEKEAKRIQLQYNAEVKANIHQFDLNSESYKNLDAQIKEKLEKALASGNKTEVDSVIKLNPELSSLKGLTSDQIIEKLGLKEQKLKITGDTEQLTKDLTAIKAILEELKQKIKILVNLDPSSDAYDKLLEIQNLITELSKPTFWEDFGRAAESGLAKIADTAGKAQGAVEELLGKLRALKSILDEIEATDPVIEITVIDQASGILAGIAEALAAIQGKDVYVTAYYRSVDLGGGPSGGTRGSHGGGGSGVGPQVSYALDATGNVGLAQAQGTLMGELGPELVVSNGRYFVAGQNGAEFVDLAADAIVFNHLQTEQLLKHGMSKQRGQAVTNERNAVAFAQGNINGGPALASAKAVLGQLKQLRAMWQSLLGASVKDLAGAGGGGGGGGGKNADPKAFIKQLEIWYNWLQRIAVLEEKINYEEAKRNELTSSFFPDGKAYVQSQKETLDYLKEQAAVSMSLAESQQEYFNKRRAEMNSANNPFSALYTFDEYGQLKYKDSGLQQLSQLVGRDSLTGKANMSAQEQYNRLVSMGYGRFMDYDSSGNPIDKEQDDWYVSAVQAFWDKIDSDKEEMQSLHDSIEEYKKAVLEKEQAMNEILHEIEENQISLENKILDAIVESRQRQIDELQKQRDALEEASQDLIDGLSEQLSKEQDMYAQQQDQSELSKLQRQLAILQRSGGSISQITSLQKEISEKQQDAYFDAQQKQIDALQEASDNQLEKLDQQIELMTETLAYEKDHGLLWNQVYQVLAGTPEQIAGFIQQNTSAYWTQSAAEVAKNMREDLFSAQKYVTYKDELGSIEAAAKIYSEKAVAEQKAKEREEEAKKKAAASSASTAAKANTSSSGSGSGGTSGSAGNTATQASAASKTSSSIVQAVAKGINNAANTTAAVAPAAAAIVKAGGVVNAVSNIVNNVTNALKTVATPVKTAATSAVSSLKSFITGKASGGYVGHGIYELGEMGTETVLTAEQTKVLRDNILSNRPNSLISLLKSYNEGYSDINKATEGLSQVSDNSTYIENATVEMHVEKIDNDYDAQRAGEQALEKIMQIARKSQGANRIRR